MPDKAKYFLISIDSEGDNLWNRNDSISTKNAKFLPRFQNLCEKYNFTPTYLVNYEMALDSYFREFARDILARQTGEIGMHLHAWNSPPLIPLTSNDMLYHPYLMEYSREVMEKKLDYLHCLLEDTFNIRPASHKAGRWGFNEVYARILDKMHYKVDCSVTPYLSWKTDLGDPSKGGGPDYCQFQDFPYLLDLDDISKSGTSNLLEIPITVLDIRRPWIDSFFDHTFRKIYVCRRLIDHYLRRVIWMCPTGGNIRYLHRIVSDSLMLTNDCIQFTLHSSEFMPGGSPFFKTKQSIENLYEHLECAFEEISLNYKGLTLSGYYDLYIEKMKINDKLILNPSL